MRTLFTARTRSMLLLLLLGIACNNAILTAQTPMPRLLSYQGVLADSKRTAVPDGPYNVTFRIYDVENGGAVLWEETNSVTTIDGVFETLLGTRSPMILPFDKSYWLALELQGEQEMRPRVRFVSAPYAMRAFQAQSAQQLDPAAPGVVHTLNGLDGNLVLIGEGQASIRVNGDTLAVVVPSTLPLTAKDGQIVRWNDATRTWEAVDLTVATSLRIAGNGSAAAPLDIAQMGATDGQPLVWDQSQTAWKPGAVGVRTAAPLKGNGTIADPLGLQDGTADRQVLAWDAASRTWRAGSGSVVGAEEISGSGIAADPLRLAQQGATSGQVLRWDETAKAWRPGASLTAITPPLRGTGSVADPLGFANGTAAGQLFFWDGTQWKMTAARAAQHGEMLRWNAGNGTWEPMGISVTSDAGLRTGALWYGDLSAKAAELTLGTANQVLEVDPNGPAPRWTSKLTMDSVTANGMRVKGTAVVDGDINAGGDVTVGRNFAVSGPNVTLPAGSVDNTELQNSTVNVAYGAGVTGDPSVALGGTLNMRNTGVVSVTGTANQVIASAPNGDVTLSLPQDIHTGATPHFKGIVVDSIAVNGDVTVGGNLTVIGPNVTLPAGSVDNTELANSTVNVAYGAGVAGDASVALGGTLNVRNTGVVSITGTANQVIASAANGDVTLSLPQNIHTDATPRFDGLLLDNMTGASTSDTLIVSNGGTLQTRTVASIATAFSGQFWAATGNSGTTAGTNYVGTNDNQPLQLHVDNANATATNGRGRVMRYEPNNTSPNIIGGFSGNNVTAGTVGNTIAGGGRNANVNSITSSAATISGGYNNSIASDLSVIAGGSANAIAATSASSTISGGSTHQINASAANSTIGGGNTNRIRPNAGTSVIAGGSSNTIDTNANTSVIAGGSNNRIAVSASTSVVSGGAGNTVNSTTAVIAGGDNGTIGTNARWSSITGGHNNTISDNAFESHIGAGEGNRVGASSVRTTIGGGSFNSVEGNSGNSTIAGGYGTTIRANADRSTIGGGMSNTIDTSSSISTIGGGFQNVINRSSNTGTISGGSNNSIAASSTLSTISGGNANTVASGTSTISGGSANSIATGAGNSTISGGNANAVGVGSSNSTIGGGQTNTIATSAGSSTIAGGQSNVVSGARSAIAGGRGLTLSGTGSFGFLGANTGSNDMQVATNNVTVLGNTALWMANNNNTASQVRYYEPNNTTGAFPGTANYSSFQSQAQAADINYVLPDTAGIVGDILKVRTVSGATVTLDWGTENVASPSWSLTGNAGTTPGTNFVGTTDDVAFQVHIGNGVATGTDGRGRVMRYEPNATSANIIGGYSANTVGGSAVGATISGGGSNGNIHSISSNYGTVGGGNRNVIGASSINSTISGGVSNSITASAGNGTIGGGLGNVITSGDHATIAGGFNNNIGTGAFGSTIAGGTNHNVNSHTSVVSGGNNNDIGTSAQFSVISGGNGHAIGNGAFESSIGGGAVDTIETGATYSRIGGGSSNAIRSNATRSTIAGGYDNEIGTGADRATISGGEGNVVSGARSAIAGGRGLTLSGTGSFGFLGANTGTNNMSVAASDVTVLGNTDVWLANNDNTASQVRYYEPNSTTGAFPGTANYSSFQSQAQTADINYVLPDTAGIVGDILKVKTVSGTTVTLNWAVENGGTPSWGLTGNAGTTPGTNFVGTTDDVAFQVHIGNGVATGTDGRGRVMRYEPNATSANIIGGYRSNSVAGSAVGATISGGGSNGSAHSISSNYGTIAGGNRNTIGASSINATISGGVSNSITASAGNGTIGGGLGNVISSGDHATISGGFNNNIATGAFGSTIAGGTNHRVSSHTSAISGGNANNIGTSSQFSVISGGNSNSINNSAFESSIGGGTTDTIETGATYSRIGGGSSNAIRSSATRSTIAGGYDNEIGTGADRATISGGEQNVVNGSRSAIAGGRGLTLSGTGSFGFLGANTGANDMTVAANNTAVFGNTDIWLANNDNAAGQLRFYSNYNTAGAFPGATKYISFQAPTALAADAEYVLPGTAGGVGDQLTITAVAGPQVTLGWAAPSDRRIKSDIITLNGENTLVKFRDVELGTWRYTNDATTRRHYGIMAQDFNRLFGRDAMGVIGTDTTVNNLDLIGVSYLAIQGLEKRTTDDRAAIEELRAMMVKMQQEMNALRQENRMLREGMK